MCGVAAIFGAGWRTAQLEAMTRSLAHRGPDARGCRVDRAAGIGLGHTRLSIVDLSDRVESPLLDASGTLWLSFNGEIYNHLELREQLSDYPFRTHSDTEVVIAAYRRWGIGCLERFVGMFAFVLWDGGRRVGYAVRDRFGVKPLHYAYLPRADVAAATELPRGPDLASGMLLLASEIKALHAAGVERRPDLETWSTYLGRGENPRHGATFWRGVRSLEPGRLLEFGPMGATFRTWYSLVDRVASPRIASHRIAADSRGDAEVEAELVTLLETSIALRFRADVPVGICSSGGVDSSLLVALCSARSSTPAPERPLTAFHFRCGDARYDETPRYTALLAALDPNGARIQPEIVELRAADVPALASSTARYQDEPFGGVPTLAYARLFEAARSRGIPVLLDGQGLDEQWAGYDYYAHAASGQSRTLQGAVSSAARPDCLAPEFRALARPPSDEAPFDDPLQNLLYRDLRHEKLPRALRFNDRASMRSSVELREPFLDHRLVELALNQPAHRKLRDGESKWLVRRVARRLAPPELIDAPKHPVQTPQREWLRGPLVDWATAELERATRLAPGWLEPAQLARAWRDYRAGQSDNAFYVWQWISIALTLEP